ncbi:MAG: sugar phosphate isomerase/epimerase [Phycisphaerae bacterium]
MPALTRRRFLGRVAGAVAVTAAVPLAMPSEASAKEEPFRLRYIQASSMYGRLPLATVLAEIPKTGTKWIDIWPEGHANHREQMDELGHARVKELLAEHGIRIGILTHYNLGPFRLQPELPLAKEFGVRLIITGGMPKDKDGARRFVETMKPHVAAAEKHGVVLGIENHGESADAIRYLADAAPENRMGVALAPYHLPQDPALLARLIMDLGPRLVHFYAWQHGKGCHEKRPKEEELLQMPGRGPLDFGPLLAALRKIRYADWTSVFMHPVPRGIPILPTAAEVTAEICRAQKHLEAKLAQGATT